MLRSYIIAFLLFGSVLLSAQQLYFEAFTGRNRPSFKFTERNSSGIDLPIYGRPTWFSSLGAKVACGLDHLQFGGEYSFDLSMPVFDVRQDSISDSIIGTHRYKHRYFGLVVRGKISRYPARRFGLTLAFGAGYMTLRREADVDGEPASVSYGKTPSFNGGIGISIPTQGMGMVEFGYTYYYADFPKTNDLPAVRGSYSSFHVGYSLNFVFGKRAAEYDKIMKF